MLKKYRKQLQVGSLDTKKEAAGAAPTQQAAPPTEKKTEAPVATATPSPSAPLEPYGDLIPFADPSWYHGVSYAFPRHSRHMH